MSSADRSQGNQSSAPKLSGASTLAITGASGMVGRALTEAWRSHGGKVRRFVRREAGGRDPAQAGDIAWNPATGEVDLAALEGVDAVVHLAGENIAEGRWNAAKKQRIRDSRVQGTRTLSAALARLPRPPRTLVSASAIGYYGDRGDSVLTEESPPGEGFLPEVCVAWEQATQEAEAAGIRVVKLRIGVVLSTQGGALAKMLTPFRLGLGGPIGSGRQYWSWISLPDLVGAIEHSLLTNSLRGPVNAVAPEATRCGEFAKTLGRVLGRPAFFPLPKFMARLALGEMSDALLLASSHVTPLQLRQSGYAFRHPTLEGALRDILKS